MCTSNCRALSSPLSAAFLLYIKCGAVKESYSGRAKVVLDLYAAENGRLGGNMITVEVIFVKDCGSVCWIQDDDGGRQGQQGLHCSKYRIAADTLVHMNEWDILRMCQHFDSHGCGSKQISFPGPFKRWTFLPLDRDSPCISRACFH